MRLLHIADLHAGAKLYGISRKEDLLYALEQVKTMCKEEKVDILLVAGDIFHQKTPDFESQNIIIEFFIELCKSGVRIVAVAGNHDSYDLMKVHKNLGKLTNVHIFDRPVRNVSEMVLHIDNLKIACLPYPNENVLTSVDEDRYREYAEKVGIYMQALKYQVKDAKYKILLAHIMVNDAKIVGSELPIYAVNAKSIPEGFDYVALGHIHQNQRIEGASSKAYYSGSLYQINFSEKDSKKSVNLVILEDGIAKVISKDLTLKRQLVEVEIKEEDNIEQALEPYANKNFLVKVIMSTKLRDPYFNRKKEMVQKILGENLAYFDPNIKVEAIKISTKQVDIGGGLDLTDLYKKFYEEKHRSDAPEKILKTLEKLIHEVSHETHKA